MFFLVLPSIVLLLLIHGVAAHRGVHPVAAQRHPDRPGAPFVGLQNYVDNLTSSHVLEGRRVHRGLHRGRGLRQLGRRARAGAAAAHPDPRRRHLQGAAAAALGGADRRLLHGDQLAGGHQLQPHPHAVREPRARPAAVPRRPDLGQDPGLRVQGVDQLPVHDDDVQRRPGQRRRDRLRGGPHGRRHQLDSSCGGSPCR